jgi:tetratricopeptide (TPR) repeat protein
VLLVRAAWLVLLLTLALSSEALASQPASSASAGAAAPALPPDAELPPLPELPKREKPPVDAEAAKQLAALLGRLTSDKADIREAAVLEVEKVDAASVGAIAQRIEEIRESIDRDRAPRVLADARKAARESRKSRSSKDDDETGDWLPIVLATPAPKDETWRELVELLAMVRMLGAIGTTPAVRELVALRGKFGDMLRIDLTRQIAKLKDKAVPALLEARKHDATTVQRFAELELDKLGRAIPGEAVGTTDPEVLADVLRAFGYNRDVDAVGVCLSFANHDRRKVRDAARQAIAGVGEPARWQLRDAYQDLTGDKPDKSVPWDVLARRIFAMYDQARLAELGDLARAGKQAAAAGKHADAVGYFDKVLARDPLFEGRAEMARSYFEVAKQSPDGQPEERLALLRKARRLAPDAAGGVPFGRELDAEIAFTEAKILLAAGKPDRFLIERALELDPSHAGAKELRASFETQAVAERPRWPRFAAAGAAALATLALVAAVLLLFRGKPAPAGAAGK